MKMWPIQLLVLFVLAVFPIEGHAAKKDCEPVKKHPVKLEAWMSKKYQPDFRYLYKEFGAMGHTRVSLWLYPSENPSRVVAIGRCVPAYIARHALRLAVEYFGGVHALVHQGFLHSHWIGVATSLFDENSFKRITHDQLDTLLDESLDTRAFQALYRRYTTQDETVQGFGLQLPNPKYLTDFDPDPYPPPENKN